jgi:hypothetical protein
LMVVEPIVGFHIHFATEKMLISRQEMQAWVLRQRSLIDPWRNYRGQEG